MSDNPIISLWAPSNRPQLWEWFYNNLRTNSVPFEVIWVGDIYPSFELPPNMRFIFSTVKISQLAYIALKHSNGELVCQIADDIEIMPHCVDSVVETYQKENDYKCMVWPRWGTGPGYDTSCTAFGPIPMGIGSVMSRKLYDEIGSIDRRYYCNTYDVDLQFRAQSSEFGARYVRLPEHKISSYVWERKDLCPGGWIDGGGWYKWNGRKDVQFLESQWYTPDQKLKSISTTPIEKFEDNDTLLTVSQGTAYDWDELHTQRKII